MPDRLLDKSISNFNYNRIAIIQTELTNIYATHYFVIFHCFSSITQKKSRKCSSLLFVSFQTTGQPLSDSNCGNAQIYIWGSVRPIYSPSTGRIYKNGACADCHGINDGIEWAPTLQCDSKTTGNDLGLYFFGSLYPSCQLHFNYVGDISDISQQRCYKDISDECIEAKYIATLPFWTNLTAWYIREACASGLVAPMLYNDVWYDNAYCILCATGIRMETCQLGGGGDLDMNSFYSLLDTSTLNKISSPEENEQNNAVFEETKVCLLSGDVSRGCNL